MEFLADIIPLLALLETEYNIIFPLICPSDFVVTKEGKIKLFRIRKNLTSINNVMDLGYLSPLAFRKKIQLEKSQAVYSLGLIVLKMLLGKSLNIIKRANMTCF